MPSGGYHIVVRAKFETMDGTIYEYFGPAHLSWVPASVNPLTNKLKLNYCEEYIKDYTIYEMFLTEGVMRPCDFPKIESWIDDDEIKEFFKAIPEPIKNYDETEKNKQVVLNKLYLHYYKCFNDGYFIINHGTDKNIDNKRLERTINKVKSNIILTLEELLEEIKKLDTSEMECKTITLPQEVKSYNIKFVQ